MIGRDMGIDAKRYTPRLLATSISNLKNELISPEQAVAALEPGGDDLAKVVAEVYADTSDGCAGPMPWTSTT